MGTRWACLYLTSLHRLPLQPLRHLWRQWNSSDHKRRMRQYTTNYGYRNFFFPRTFLLAQGLVGTFLLGSFQACAVCMPAAPDVRGNRAKSKPLLLRGRLRCGRRLGGGWLPPAPYWLEVGCRLWRCSRRSQIQETGRIGGHSCMGDLGRPPVDQGIREWGLEPGWDGSGFCLGQQP